MKKYISLIVCSVLLAIAVIAGTPKNSDVIYGRGNGQDYKVNTIEQFAEVLDFFKDYQLVSSNEKSAKSGISGFDSSADEDSTESKKDYTSATFYNKSRGAINYSYSYSGMSSSSKTTFMRELTIYFTQTAVYYKSVGTVMSKSSYSSGDESESVSSIMDFDIDIYMTAEHCYIKFNKFNMSVSGSDDEDGNFVTTDMLDKWFDAGEIAEYFLEINESNYEILSSINDYFEENKFSNFKQSNSVYTLKDDAIKSFFSFILGTSVPDKVKGTFKVNLSTKARPTVTLISSYGDSQENGDVSASGSSYSEDNIAFSNINNTIIQFKANKIYDLNDYLDEEDMW